MNAPSSPDSSDSGRPPIKHRHYRFSYSEKALLYVLDDILDDFTYKYHPERPTGPASSLRQAVDLPLDKSAQFPGPFTPSNLLKNAITEDAPDVYQIPIDQRVIDWSIAFPLQHDPALQELLRPICQDRLALANGIREVCILGYLHGISEPLNPAFFMGEEHDHISMTSRLVARIQWSLTNVSAGADFYFTYRAKLIYSLSRKHAPPPCPVNRPSDPEWERL